MTSISVNMYMLRTATTVVMTPNGNTVRLGPTPNGLMVPSRRNNGGGLETRIKAMTKTKNNAAYTTRWDGARIIMCMRVTYVYLHPTRNKKQGDVPSGLETCVCLMRSFVDPAHREKTRMTRDVIHAASTMKRKKGTRNTPMNTVVYPPSTSKGGEEDEEEKHGPYCKIRSGEDTDIWSSGDKRRSWVVVVRRGGGGCTHVYPTASLHLSNMK